MITIVDYQMGNLRSVQKAIEKIGSSAEITDSAARISAARRLVLPGVGGFPEAMAELRRRDLIQPIRDYIASGRPFLGICLGLQLLFETGEEGGEHEGMGVLPGRCVRFRLPHEYKVPHMGWNSLQIVQREPLFVGIPDGTYFYFVHSYHVEPSDRSIIAATSDYGGPFCAAIARKNLFAVQFHPEKSQAVGQRLLANFAALPETN